MASSNRSVPTSHEFNLDKLTEFNPAIIYMLRPEISSRPGSKPDPRDPNYLMVTAGQYLDLFEAYMYAQENILPVIATKGIAAITAKDLLVWLKQIHIRAAHTLAHDVDQPQFAGNYTNEESFLSEPFVPLILRDLFSINAPIDLKHLQAVMKHHQNMFETEDDINNIIELFNSGAVQEILNLLKELLAKNGDEPIEANQITFLVAMVDLGKIYSQNGFSAAQKDLIHKFFMIGVAPDKIAEHMKILAEEILTAWKNCDANKPEEVVQLLSDEFISLLKCHPYFNANGRIATVLMNITLRSLNLPSIVLRTEDSNHPLNVAYTKATKNISTQPELLTAHIKKCMNMAQVKPSYDKAIITFRVAATNWMRQIMSEFPKFDMGKFYSIDIFKIMTSVPDNVQRLTPSDLIELNALLKIFGFEDLSIAAIQPDSYPKIYAILGGNRIVNALAAQYKILATKVSAHNNAVTSKTYSTAEKDSIVNHLTALTQQTKWQRYNANGLTLILECESKLEAEKIADALTATSALNAKMQSLAGKIPKVFVVKIEAINTEKLLKVTTLKDFARQSDNKPEKKLQA